MDQIDLFKNHLYLIEPCAKKAIKKQLYTKSKYTIRVAAPDRVISMGQIEQTVCKQMT